MNFDTVLVPLTAILTRWINQYHISTPHQSLYDLTNGEFFLAMLSRVDGFKWIQKPEWSAFKDIATGERIKRMRIVGRSITRFYQEHLSLSLDNLAFNYIDMCCSNPDPEILRLFIAVLGVFTRCLEINLQIDDFLHQLEQDQAQLFSIMINYASNLGDKIEQSESPMKRQKRLLTKLQSLEEELQFYEQYTEQIQAKCQQLSEQADRHRRRMEELEANGDRLAKRAEILQSTNEEINKELQRKVREEEVLRERLATNRQTAQQVVDRLVDQNQKVKKQLAHCRSQLAQKTQTQFEQTKILLLCEEKENHIRELKRKLQKQSEDIQRTNEELRITTQELQKLTNQHQGLRVKLELLEKSFPRNSPEYISPQQKSILIWNRLGDSYLQQTPKEWFTIEEEGKGPNQSRIAESESLTFSNHTDQSLSFPAHMGFMNLKDLQSSFRPQEQTDKENLNPNRQRRQLKLCDIEEQKSIVMSENQMSSSFREQLELAMNVIFDLQSNLISVRKELGRYKARQAERACRSARFAAKVNDMFG